MAYEIKKHGATGTHNGGKFNVDDNTQNSTATSLSLVGKYWVGYGETIAQNSVKMLENFASDVEPSNPIEGQLWWNPSNKTMYIRNIGTWVGIDSDSKLTTVKDAGNTDHTVVVCTINTIPFSITSSDPTAWTINTSETVLEPYFRDNGLVGTPGDATVKPGINLNTDSTKGYVFHGTATHAQYADVAENYTSDKELEPGTLITINKDGESEVTETTHALDSNVIGVVTTDPALLMNSALSGLTVGVALLGRTPCKVIGEVMKGDRIVSSDIAGHGQSIVDFSYQHVVGRAVESKTTPGEGIIEVVIGVK
jgi:hypothetical protein